MKYLIIVGILLASVTAYAQFNGCPSGFCNVSASGGSGPPANALLSQTGVCIEAQSGSCILVQ